jgi:PAS domain-containing protein
MKPAPSVTPHEATPLERSEAQTVQANTRTDEANFRTAEADARTVLADTRAKQAEARTETSETKSAALEASELSYRRLFEAARDGILILDFATGRILDANPFLVELLCFSREEMIDKTVGELSPFKDLVANQRVSGEAPKGRLCPL